MPDEMRRRDAILKKFKSIFRRYGYECIETPALEYWETLSGKYGAEGERLIYRLTDRGGRELGLRYDLTVPLARFIATHPEIPKPFKRYQIQPVWRAEKPQKGRYREFYQCDVDVVGASDISADAEIIALLCDCIDALEVDFSIRINNRKLIRALVERLRLHPENELPLARIIDKLERDGLMKVLDDAQQLNLGKERLSILKEFLSLRGYFKETLETASRLLGDSARPGIDELQEMSRYLKHHGIRRERLIVDLSLARGLDYYTGPIYEVQLKDADVGSIGGGGRYDDLLGMFVGRKIPATGASIGLDRLMAADGVSVEVRRSAADILICRFSKETEEYEYMLARRLRDAGFSVDVYLGRKDLRAQLGYASDKSIPVVVITGTEEVAGNRVRLKTMETGEQFDVGIDSLLERLNRLIKR